MEYILNDYDVDYLSYCNTKKEKYWDAFCSGDYRGIFAGKHFYASELVSDDVISSTTHLELNTYKLPNYYVKLSEFGLGDLSSFTNLEFLHFRGDISEVNLQSLDKLRVLMTSTRSLYTDGIQNLPPNLDTLVITDVTFARDDPKFNNLASSLSKLVFVSSILGDEAYQEHTINQIGTMMSKFQFNYEVSVIFKNKLVTLDF